jgi:hypothetical protein
MPMCYQCNGRDTCLCAINVMGETHAYVLSMQWERHMSMCYQCNGRDPCLCAINGMGETHVYVLSM